MNTEKEGVQKKHNIPPFYYEREAVRIEFRTRDELADKVLLEALTDFTVALESYLEAINMTGMKIDNPRISAFKVLYPGLGFEPGVFEKVLKDYQELRSIIHGNLTRDIPITPPE